MYVDGCSFDRVPRLIVTAGVWVKQRHALFNITSFDVVPPGLSSVERALMQYGIAYYESKLDDGVWSRGSKLVQFSGLSIGHHVALFRAVDRHGEWLLRFVSTTCLHDPHGTLFFLTQCLSSPVCLLVGWLVCERRQAMLGMKRRTRGKSCRW